MAENTNEIRIGEIIGNVDKLNAVFEKTDGGWIGYKVFNSMYVAPSSWEIEVGKTITESRDQVDTDVMNTCGSGINVANSVQWVKNYVKEISNNEFGKIVVDIWKVFIPYSALIVVPTHTDGKIRTDEIRLLEIVGEAHYEDWFEQQFEDEY